MDLPDDVIEAGTQELDIFRAHAAYGANYSDAESVEKVFMAMAKALVEHHKEHRPTPEEWQLTCAQKNTVNGTLNGMFR